MEGNKRLRRNERCAREKDKYVQNENASPRNEGAQRSLDSCSFLFVRSVLSSIFFLYCFLFPFINAHPLLRRRISIGLCSVAIYNYAII